MKKKVVIIGAGPAGLATAYEFVKQKKTQDFELIIFEMDNQVGGLAKTLEYKGYRFDIGGHRFYTKFKQIDDFYKKFLGKDMLKRTRLSRIYYNGKFYDYPLSAANALKNLGIRQSIKICISWLGRQIKKHKSEKTFDEWVSNRFGDELFKIFFKSYTEKVWGIPTSKLSADWAAQRIQNFNLLIAIVNAVFKINPGAKTIIKHFYYPKYGPGMLYAKMQKLLEQNGIKIYFGHEVIKIIKRANKITAVVVKNDKGRTKTIKVDYLVSTMPFDKLILALNPPPDLARKVKKLKFRNFITVNLIVKSNLFPDQWIYIHDPTVKVGRIQNFRNWSPFMAKKGSKNTPIGMEYFTSEGDELWHKKDNELIKLAKKEIVKIGLLQPQDIVDAFVYRVKNAYPIYNFNYKTPLNHAKRYVNQFPNLYLCGRGGLFRYNNQDHSILTGFFVAKDIIGGKHKHDVWSVGEEGYLEAK